MSSKTPDPAEVAKLLGMKPGEVVEVVLVADGVLAQTHDGGWTLIRNDGGFEFNVEGPGVDEAGKSAPRRRSRG